MRYRGFGALLMMIAFVSTAFAGDKLSVDDLVSKHLDAVFTERNTIRLGRGASGVAIRDVLLGGTGHREGKASFVSKDNAFQLVLDFNSSEYLGEQYTWDGAHSRSSANGVDKYSALAQFVQQHEELMRDGLFGGTLNAGWALSTLKTHNPKLHYDGLKKFNGKMLHQVTYIPKKSDNDLTVRLYFDPETFRHVASTYEFAGQLLSLSQNIPKVMTTPGQNMPDTQKVVEHVEENFSDFKPEGGLTLPHHWQLRYMQEHGSSMSIRFEINFAKIETGGTPAGSQ